MLFPIKSIFVHSNVNVLPVRSDTARFYRCYVVEPRVGSRKWGKQSNLQESTSPMREPVSCRASLVACVHGCTASAWDIPDSAAPLRIEKGPSTAPETSPVDLLSRDASCTVARRYSHFLRDLPEWYGPDQSGLDTHPTCQRPNSRDS